MWGGMGARVEAGRKLDQGMRRGPCRCCRLEPLPLFSHGQPTVFFNIAIDGEPLDCVSFKLFADKVPKIAENFRALSTGEKGCVYKGSCFHRIL